MGYALACDGSMAIQRHRPHTHTISLLYYDPPLQVDVFEKNIWSSGEYVHNHFIEGRDKALYLCPDRINDAEVRPPPTPRVVLPYHLHAAVISNCSGRTLAPYGTGHAPPSSRPLAPLTELLAGSSPCSWPRCTTPFSCPRTPSARASLRSPLRASPSTIGLLPVQVVPLHNPSEMWPVLACQDRYVRVLKGNEVCYEAPTPAAPVSLQYVVDSHDPQHRFPSAKEVLYGTDNGGHANEWCIELPVWAPRASAPSPSSSVQPFTKHASTLYQL